MKITTFLLLFTGLLVSSCINDPNFPSKPNITLEDLKFYEIGDNNDPDSLQVIIKFEDAEGDLGLANDEDFAPYNLHNYFNNKTGQVVDFSLGSISSEDLLTYKDRDVIDSLPPFEAPYTCTRWTTSPNLYINDTTRLKDTVYFQFNPRHYNFFVEFYHKVGTEFKKYDFREINCSTFDGRFPLITKGGEKNTPKEGYITYNMQSKFFLTFFEGETLQLRIRIVDRSGQYSQWLTTEPFTLRGIQAN